MLSFLLTSVLKRSIPFVVAWTFGYFTLFGDLVIRGGRLYADEQRRVVVAQAEKITLSPQWSSIFEQQILIDKADVSGARMVVALEDPLRAINAFHRRRQVHQADAAVGGADGTGEPAKNLPPLELAIRELTAAKSEVILQRGVNEIKMRIVAARAKDAFLPLDGRDLTAEADLYAIENKAQGKEYPVRVRLVWKGETKELFVQAFFADIPIEWFQLLFPDTPLAGHFPSFVQVESTSGRLSGSLILHYSNEETGAGRWRLVEHFPRS